MGINILYLRCNIKWFKHDTDAFFSEGIDSLIETEGFAGYGRWNRLLEIIAYKMDKTNRCHVEYSIKKWCSLLKLKQKKLSSFLELTENQLKTKVVYVDNKIRIEIPNLLKKRDNYTKDLEATDKKLPSKEVEVEVEVEVDNIKEKSKKKSHFLTEADFNRYLKDEAYITETAKSLDTTAGNVRLYIEKIRDGCLSHGFKGNYRYYDLIATVRNWMKRDGVLGAPGKKKSSREEEFVKLREKYGEKLDTEYENVIDMPGSEFNEI